MGSGLKPTGLVLSASLIILGLLTVETVGKECYYSEDGVSYDLSSLQDDKALSILGGDLLETSTIERTWNYTFAVCRQLSLSEIPASCKKNDERLDAAAYQTVPKTDQESDDMCIPTGLWETDGSSSYHYSIELFSIQDKTAGVNITYKGGKMCSNNVKRQFSIHVRCADVQHAKAVSVVELGKDGRPNQCHYQASIESIAGCPTECGRGQNDEGEMSLCSGRGICGYDRTAGQVSGV